MRYTIVLERGDDGWGAVAPEAIADYLDALHEAGQPLPEPGEWAVPIEVPAA